MTSCVPRPVKMGNGKGVKNNGNDLALAKQEAGRTTELSCCCSAHD